MFTILLVHDNSESMDVVRGFLERMGDVRVDTVGSAKQAVDMLGKRTYDLIISYFRLPAVTGIEFVQETDGIGLLRCVRNMGRTTPVLLYMKSGKGKMVVTDLLSGVEFPVPRDPHGPVPELRDMIRQAILRKRAEREQVTRAEMLAAILAATPLCIAQVRGPVIEWVNPSLARLIGTPAGELTGKPVSCLFPEPRDCERTLRLAALSPDDAGFGTAETILSHKDGSPIRGCIRVRPIDPADPSRGDVLVFEDQTAIQRLKEDIRLGELRNRDLVKNAAAIIVRMDSAGTITFINQAAQSFFGYSAPEITGKNIVGTLLPESARPARETVSLFNEGTGSREEDSIRITENTLRSGEQLWMAWIDTPMRDESGHITEIVSIGHDITDRSTPGRPRISTASWREGIIADTDIREDVFDAVFHICVEISREGREGKAIGTSFILGDSANVLNHSCQLILNPFEGHRAMITNPEFKENVKEISQLDGAFIIGGDGLIHAGARRITVDTSDVGIPKGLGTRHSSVAGITQATRSVGIVVSQSGGRITIFKEGTIAKEIS